MSRRRPARRAHPTPRVGQLRYITGDEALRQTIEVDRYLSQVQEEIRKSGLTPDEKSAFETFYAGYRNNVQDVVNTSWLGLNMAAASISDRAESARDQGRAWSERARKAGAPNLAGKGPAVPGETSADIAGTAKWIAIAVLGVVAIQAIRAFREA